MEVTIVLLNFLYAIVGAFITLFVMAAGYLMFDKITPFNTAEELSKSNQAVGSVIAAIFIGTGIAVGLVIGLGLN